jgi:DNA-directed RNA polymerase specialized sigma24 family protein
MTDWTIIENDTVYATCRVQAIKVALAFPGVIEADDLLQEALITVATHPMQVRDYLETNRLGLLAHMIWCDLTDIARKYARQSNLAVSLEEIEDRHNEVAAK